MCEAAVLLGLFDGLHRGHIRAVDELIRSDGRKIVFTFDSATLTVKGERGLLMTDDEKRRELLRLGVDEVISRDFSAVKDISPEDFVEKVLLRELGAKKVICGENFRFGRGGTATSNDLMTICGRFGIETKVVPTLCEGGEPISTTRIRRLIEQGNVSEANLLLGYDYGFEGEVAHGSRIGTAMGIKTVNLEFDPRRVMPKKGVYASETEIRGRVYSGVTNVGQKPTVNRDGEVNIETHILNFDGDVYGVRIKTRLKKFMREEKRFGTLAELRAAVANDINTVKESLML